MRFVLSGVCRSNFEITSCVFCFEQTRTLATAMNALRAVTEEILVFTSAECRAQAEQKLAQAQRDDRNRKRLIAAAEAWLFLASQIRPAKAAFPDDEAVAKRRAKRVKASGP